MEKVNSKWFKSNGWTERDSNTVEIDGTKKHITTFSLNRGKLVARWDRVIYDYPALGRYPRKVSRFYMFYAKGDNGFQVENRVSHYNFPTDIITASLKVVGYDVEGNKIN